MFKVSTDYNELATASIIFVTVGTPSYTTGDINLSYIRSAVMKLGKVLSRKKVEYPVIAIKSTVIPGTTRAFAQIVEKESDLKLGSDFGVVFNPEFLREGRALEDMLNPSRIVIGELDSRGADMLEGFWRDFYSMLGRSPPIIRVTAETAEMSKYASNAFLAVKISFINTIARICEKTPRCDVVDVARIMGLDPRIGPHYLEAGLGYGGSCLPKDVKALIAYAKRLCIEPKLLEAADWVNETQPYHVVMRLEEILGDLEGKVITILGVAFKPDTDDVRESRSLILAELLAERGALVRLHDPNSKALENAKRVLGSRVEYYSSIDEALRNADAAIVATAWDYYRRLTPSEFRKLMKSPIILDARRIYDPTRFLEEGVRLYAIGRGEHC
jgi:nucleotide sugar dehydrogenase